MVFGSHLGDATGVRIEEPVSKHEDGARARGSRRLEGTFDLADTSNLQRDQLPALLSRRCFDSVPARKVRPVPENCHRRGPGTRSLRSSSRFLAISTP